MAESQTMAKIINCVVVGAILVGKTSLIRRYVTNKFPTDLLATLGMDISVKELDLNFGLVTHHVEIVLRDISGHYRFECLYKGFLRAADAAVIVVAQDDPDSFYGRKSENMDKVISIDEWVDRIDDANKPNHVPKILVINKSDLPKNLLNDEEIIAVCKKYKILGAYRTSAKTGENVSKVFQIVAGIPRGAGALI
jgi:small GTP-binding protein